MRTFSRAGALSAVAAVAVFAAPVTAHAAPPGDNGDVKIHKSTTDEFDERNEPHACSFYLDAFDFDGLAKVDWHIEAWAPSADSKGETVKTGSITLDGKGHGRTEDLSLADGHYKLFWNFEGEKGAAKHKVFWTECGDEEGGGSSSSPSPSGSASSSASASASASPSSSVSASVEPSGSAGSTPSSAPGPQGEGGGLAETGNGAPVGALAGVAAVLLGAGGYLVVRRRRA
ncbi:LPXTG cell wall anchor domain-containing protein [Streptomyces sp. NBC_01235]|uniref:LPXTG cell wall anchor domain-containing protein n=1 Tax=Streptomyces sp. NBC_01235 TaxID=2903788 RepID=UPI002E15DF7F|nr:LPXTG cell wall anchor domain-containing protein [Streptomyces sp. NBC_01235]